MQQGERGWRGLRRSGTRTMLQHDDYPPHSWRRSMTCANDTGLCMKPEPKDKTLSGSWRIFLVSDESLPKNKDNPRPGGS